LANDPHLDLREEAMEKSIALGRSAVKTAIWSVVIYPAVILASMIGCGMATYVYADAYLTSWLYALSVCMAVMLGGVGGFFLSAAIVSSMVGDLVFDAGWEGVKLGWKAGRQTWKKSGTEKSGIGEKRHNQKDTR
jgi:hypothetical protein